MWQILQAELWGVLGCSTTETVTPSWCHPQPWAKGQVGPLSATRALGWPPGDAKGCPRRLSPAPHLLTEREQSWVCFFPVAATDSSEREKTIISPNVLGK